MRRETPVVAADPAPWPLRRVVVAFVAGLLLPLALLPWAGGLLLIPYFLAAPAGLGFFLAPQGGDRNGYQAIGVAVAVGGALSGAGWNVANLVGESAWPAVLVSGLVSFLLLSLVPVVLVILFSNRLPTTTAS